MEMEKRGVRAFLARRLRAVLGVLAMATAIVVATAGTAHASGWGTSDGFEYDPGATWSLYHVGVGGGGFEYNIGSAHNGLGNAWLDVTTGWSSLAMTQRVTPGLAHQATCGVSVAIQPWGSATVNIEIVDPATWTYIALNTVTLTGYTYVGTGVGPFKLGPTSPSQPDVVVRFSLLGNGSYQWIRIDDYSMSCSYY